MRIYDHDDYMSLLTGLCTATYQADDFPSMHTFLYTLFITLNAPYMNYSVLLLLGKRSSCSARVQRSIPRWTNQITVQLRNYQCGSTTI